MLPHHIDGFMYIEAHDPHATMSHDICPAIRRDWTDADSEATVLHTMRDDTRYRRGVGTSGRKVQHVEHTCPCCTHEEMIRLVDVSPCDVDGVSYWCLMPNCRYFVADELSWATKPHPEYKPETPMRWQQTHECTECGSREHIEITKDQFRIAHVEDGIVMHACDDCLDRHEWGAEA